MIFLKYQNSNSVIEEVGPSFRLKEPVWGESEFLCCYQREAADFFLKLSSLIKFSQNVLDKKFKNLVIAPCFAR